MNEMTDYIDRQEAIDAVYYAIGDGDKADFCVDVIRSIPSADVEPVVRCRDCIHRNGDYCHNDDGFAHFDHFFVQMDDFCSRGERMDGEQDG